MPDPSADDPLGRLTALVRERYETGAYGRAHFRMPQRVFDALRAASPPPTPSFRPPSMPNLDALLGIPIVLDESLSGWQLVDMITKEVIASGCTE